MMQLRQSQKEASELNSINGRMQNLQLASFVQNSQQKQSKDFRTDQQYVNHCIEINPTLITYLKASHIKIPLKTNFQIDCINQLVEKKSWISKLTHAPIITQASEICTEIDYLMYTKLQDTYKEELLLIFKLKYGDLLRGVNIAHLSFVFRRRGNPLNLMKPTSSEQLLQPEIDDKAPIHYGEIPIPIPAPNPNTLKDDFQNVQQHQKYIYREEDTCQPYFTLGILHFHFHFDKEVKKRHFYIHTPQNNRGQSGFLKDMVNRYRTYQCFKKTITDIHPDTDFVVIDNYMKKDHLKYNTIELMTHNFVSFSSRFQRQPYTLNNRLPTFIIMSKLPPEQNFASDIINFRGRFNNIHLEEYFQDCRNSYRQDPINYTTKEWHFTEHPHAGDKYAFRFTVGLAKNDATEQKFNHVKETLIAKLKNYIARATIADAKSRFIELHKQYVLTCSDIHHQALLDDQEVTNLLVECNLRYKYLTANFEIIKSNL